MENELTEQLINEEELEHCLWTVEGEEFDLAAACARDRASPAPSSSGRTRARRAAFRRLRRATRRFQSRVFSRRNLCR